MNIKKIMVVFGTRPEAIKMAPLVLALKNNPKFEVKVCVTAQHREMLDQVLDLFEIQPDFDLNIMQPGQDLFFVTEKVISGMKIVLTEYQPNWILVHGDTTTSFAAALSGFYFGCKIAHIEAGLRTYDIKSPFPEEANRQLTSRLSDLHFAPTEYCKKSLLNEGVNEKSIFVTGNTVIDALFLVREKLNFSGKITKILGDIHPDLLTNKKVVLITAHRRENFGDPINRIFEAIKKSASQNHDVLYIYPVHPNPNIKTPAAKILSGLNNVVLIDPLDYESLVCLMDRSTLILTDSGGIQEEAPSLGKKVLVLRDVTERQEAVSAGVVELVGSDSTKIINSIALYLNTENVNTMNPFGNGTACSQIVEALELM